MTPAQKAEIDQQRSARNAPAPNMSIEQGNERADRKAYKQVFDEAGPVDQFMAGVGKAPMQLYYGAKDALGLADAEDEQTMRMMEEIHGLGTAGEVVGDVAMFMLPGGAVAKGANAVTKGAPMLARAGTMLAGESALAGGIEGLKAPEAGETRGGNATEAAAWTAALGLPFAVASKFAPQITAEAQKLLDKGIALTPGMASSGGWRTGIEKFMGNIPGLGGKVEKMQDVAIQDWNKYLLNKVSPDGDEIADIGHEGFKQVQDRFKREYTDIWDSVTPDSFDLSKFDTGLENARAVGKALPEADAQTAQRVLDQAEEYILQFADSGQAGAIENMDDVLRELGSEAATNGNMLLNDFYGEMRTALRRGVGDDVSKRLTKADKLYRDFKTVEHGGSYIKAQEADAVLNPRGLESAVKARNKPAATTKGQGSMQGDASDATKSIAQVLPERSQISVGPDIGKWGTALGIGATGVVPGLAVLGGTRAMLNEGMRKFLTGTPIGEFKLPTRIMRMMRQAGVESINDIEDPVFKQAIVNEVEQELAANQE